MEGDKMKLYISFIGWLIFQLNTGGSHTGGDASRRRQLYHRALTPS